MSLTTELSSSKSWVNHFFKNRFDGVVRFVRAEGPDIKALEPKVPTTLKRQALSRVGTAIDYCIRLEMGLRPLESQVIQEGITRMELFGVENTPKEKSRWADELRLNLQTMPHNNSDEDRARTAILLAHLDAGFRSGGLWGKTMIELAREVRRGWTLDDFIEIATWNESAEVVQLMRLARKALNLDAGQDAVLGPVFAGSKYVGGADADLIIQNHLYDIKTTPNPRNGLPNAIRQLIGYVLLDWDNEYNIQGVGLYLSRQGQKVEWKLDELLARTATDPHASLSDLREEFMELAFETHWEKTSRTRRTDCRATD